MPAYCVAPEPQCLPVPKGFTMVEAAALPETFFTVWTNLFERGRLRPGETVLIHGGSSGIGTTAIQLARRCGAQPIFATAGSRDKCHACEALGATRGIDYKHEDFVKVVKDATGGRGVDVMLDMVGGDYIQRNLSRAGAGGPPRLSSPSCSGATATINLLPIMLKRAHRHRLDAARARPSRRRARSPRRSAAWSGRCSSKARSSR